MPLTTLATPSADPSVSNLTPLFPRLISYTHCVLRKCLLHFLGGKGRNLTPPYGGPESSGGDRDSGGLNFSPHHALVPAVGLGIPGRRPRGVSFLSQVLSASPPGLWTPCPSLPALSQDLYFSVLLFRGLQSMGVSAINGLAISPSP